MRVERTGPNSWRVQNGHHWWAASNKDGGWGICTHNLRDVRPESNSGRKIIKAIRKFEANHDR